MSKEEKDYCHQCGEMGWAEITDDGDYVPPVDFQVIESNLYCGDCSLPYLDTLNKGV